jgi:N-carbamoyl-L-amino-acid hydrolase
MGLDPKRTIRELKELRALTATEDGAQRVAWTDIWLTSRTWFESKLHGLPVEHHLDAAGNRWVTLQGASDRALLLGSHLDSVPNGGWLDGSLGVLAALEVLRRIAEEFKGRPPITIRRDSLCGSGSRPHRQRRHSHGSGAPPLRRGDGSIP